MNDKPCILIVEDEEDSSRSLVHILAKHGYDTETAETGKEALAEARRKDFDLAFLDIKLPDMNGIDLIAPLKELHPDIVLIMVTSYASVETAVQVLNFGAENYVTKPFDMNKLLADVRAVLEKQHLSREKQRIERDLQKSEAKYRSLVETPSAGIANVDTSGNLTFVNQTLCNMIGYTHEEILGTPFLNYLHPDDIKRTLELFQYGLQHPEESQQLEYQLVHKNGRTIHCYSAPTNISQASEIIGFSAIILDISERIHTEKSLSESEEKYRTLVERTNDGIAIIQDGRVRFANPRLAGMWGGEHAEIVGTPLTDFIDPDELTQVTDRYKRRLAGEAVPAVYETVLRRKDGNKIYAELNAGVITYEGKPADFVIIRDITRRKQFEEQIYQRNADLVLINALNAAANRGASLAKLIDLLYKQMKERFNIIGAAVYLLSEDGQYLEMQKQFLPEQVIRQIKKITGLSITKLRLPTGENLHYRKMVSEGIFKGHDPEIIREIILGFVDGASLPEKVKLPIRALVPRIQKLIKVQSFLATPLINQGRSLGMLSLSFERDYTPEDITRLKLLDGQISAIIQRKQAEEMLEDEEQKFRTLFDHAIDGILIADLETRRFSLGNQAICRMLGYQVEELPAIGVDDIHPVDHLPQVIEQFERQARGEIELAESLPVKRKDGSVFYADINSTSFTLGDRSYMLGIFRDITKRKQAEEALKEKMDELQRWYDVMLTREDRNLALKGEVNELLRRLGQPVRYPSAEES
jgi:PAS domain S-box-containing protein